MSFKGARGGPRKNNPYNRVSNEGPPCESDIMEFCEKWNLQSDSVAYLRKLPASIFKIVATDFTVADDVRDPSGLLKSFTSRVGARHSFYVEYPELRGNVRDIYDPPMRQGVIGKPHDPSLKFVHSAVVSDRTHRAEKCADTIMGFAKKWSITQEGIHKLQMLDFDSLHRVIKDFAPKVTDPVQITELLVKFTDGITTRQRKEESSRSPVDAFIRTWRFTEPTAMKLQSIHPTMREFAMRYFTATGAPADVDAKFDCFLDDLIVITDATANDPESFVVAPNDGDILDADDFVVKYSLDEHSIRLLTSLKPSERFRVLRDFDPPARKTDLNPIFAAFAQSVVDAEDKL